MNDIFEVCITKKALKDLRKVPLYIALKLQAWIDNVGNDGLNSVRKFSGYHDEPLIGDRLGQRSIRLSKGYRAIYVIAKDNSINFVKIIKVSKHDYSK